MLRLFTIVALLLIAATSISLAWTKHQTLRHANYRISQLEREVRVLRGKQTKQTPETALAPKTKSGSSVLADPPTTIPAMPAPATTPTTPQSLAEWRVSQELEQVEEFVSLTEAERESLRSEILETLRQLPEKRSRLNDTEREQTLTTVLGEERARQLSESIEAQRTEVAARELDDETYALSRKLDLTAEQEENLRNALASTQTLLKAEQERLSERMSNAMAQHFDGDPERTRLREAYAEIRELSQQIKDKKYTALSQQLQGILSDEQLTALVAERNFDDLPQ